MPSKNCRKNTHPKPALSIPDPGIISRKFKYPALVPGFAKPLNKAFRITFGPDPVPFTLLRVALLELVATRASLDAVTSEDPKMRELASRAIKVFGKGGAL